MPVTDLVPRWLRIWAILTVLAAIPLVILGAEVTTKGVGMADTVSVRTPWYFFTLDLSQTPLGLLIEHGHRFFGWILGIFAIVLALGLTFFARGWQRWIGWPVLVMVSAQGIFGILRVKYNALGGPELAAFHGCFAQLAFATLVTTAILLSKSWWAGSVTFSHSLIRSGITLSLFMYVQIVFGAIVRHTLDPVSQRIHILMGIVIVVKVVWLFGKLRSQAVDRTTMTFAWVLLGLIIIQPVFGVEAWIRRFGAGEYAGSIPSNFGMDLARSSHHLIGTLIFCTTIGLTTLFLRPQTASPATSAQNPFSTQPMEGAA